MPKKESLSKHAGWIISAFILLGGIVGSYHTLKADVKKNEKEICRIDEREKLETRRSTSIDNARTGQMARFETKLEYIQEDIKDLKDTNKEILRLIRKQSGD